MKTWRIQFLVDSPDEYNNDLVVEGIIGSALAEIGFTFDGKSYVDAREVTAEREIE